MATNRLTGMSGYERTHKVLIVDDSFINRAMLEDILKDDFKLELACDGEEALKALTERPAEFGVVLLDLNMPKVSGFEVLKVMSEKKLLEQIPVIVISADASEDSENTSLDMRATDFIRKPFDGRSVLFRVKNIYDLYSYKRNLERRIADQTKELRDSNDKLREYAARIEDFNENTIELLGMVVEYRHSESGQHIQRVKDYTELLGNEMMKRFPEYGLTPEDVDRIADASVLHDLGKIAIPDAVMLKPGRLTDEEYEEMKLHTVKGDELAGQVKGAWDEEFGTLVHQICRNHHERWDGRGYPDGLAGDDIPIAAQLVSIADVYDALVTDRVYKAAYTHEEACRMICAGECGVFSPKLLECFKALGDEFVKVKERNAAADIVNLHA